MQINRRHCLMGSVAFAGCAATKGGKEGQGASGGLAAARVVPVGERWRLAMIGCGIQMRRTLIPQFLDPKYNATLDIVATCDCDRTRAAAAAKQVNDATGKAACRAVADFREILADPSIDAVCIATPDHWHAYMSVEAMKHGKDVYCEKPLTFSIDEAKKVIEAQKKYGRVFQTGSMQRSWRVFRTATALVRGGVIGTVRYVDANYGKGGQKLGGPSHPIRFFDDPKNATKESEGYELLGEKGWDMWRGPAKWRPYSNQLAPVGVNKFYPMFWRFDDDIGSGYNGDWGAHHLDIAQWGIDMDRSGPYKILCSDEPHSTDLFHGGRRQFGMRMLFRKPNGGDIELYHGPFGVWGTVFYGTNGIVAVNRGKIAVWVGTGLVTPTPEVRKALEDMSFMKDKVVAASVGKDYGTDAMAKKDNALDAALAKLQGTYAAEIRKAGLYVSLNQVKNFIDCCLTREPTISPAEVGGRSCTLCLLCNMSYQYDTGFDWDGEKMDFAPDSGAGLSLTREGDCNGWTIEV